MNVLPGKSPFGQQTTAPVVDVASGRTVRSQAAIDVACVASKLEELARVVSHETPPSTSEPSPEGP